jgi:hypothetical protein
LMMSHTTIRFSYGPRGPGFGKLASIISARPLGHLCLPAQYARVRSIRLARQISN